MYLLTKFIVFKQVYSIERKKKVSCWKWAGELNLLANTFLEMHAVWDELLI